MSEITSVDSNFKIESKIQEKEIKFYDAKTEPFKIYGLYYELGQFRRLPLQTSKKVSDAVVELHTHTAGGRVRFKTDSAYVAIYAKMPYIGKMPHFAISGSAGFDLYAVEDDEERYIKTFVPPFDIDRKSVV